MIYNNFSLFADFPHPVFLLASDGTLLEANRCFIETYFSRAGEIRGKNIYDLTAAELHSPEFAAKRKADVERVISTGEHLIIDDDYVEGGVFRSSIYPVKSDDGNVERILIIIHTLPNRSRRNGRPGRPIIYSERFSIPFPAASLSSMKHAFSSAAMSRLSLFLETGKQKSPTTVFAISFMAKTSIA